MWPRLSAAARPGIDVLVLERGGQDGTAGRGLGTHAARDAAAASRTLSDFVALEGLGQRRHRVVERDLGVSRALAAIWPRRRPAFARTLSPASSFSAVPTPGKTPLKLGSDDFRATEGNQPAALQSCPSQDVQPFGAFLPRTTGSSSAAERAGGGQGTRNSVKSTTTAKARSIAGLLAGGKTNISTNGG